MHGAGGIWAGMDCTVPASKQVSARPHRVLAQRRARVKLQRASTALDGCQHGPHTALQLPGQVYAGNFCGIYLIYCWMAENKTWTAVTGNPLDTSGWRVSRRPGPLRCAVPRLLRCACCACAGALHAFVCGSAGREGLG